MPAAGQPGPATVRAEAGATRFVVEPAEQRRVTERFIAACSSGDLDGLLAVLDPDVAGEADVGDRVGVRTVIGRVPVATGLMRFFGPDSSTTLLSLPAGGHAGVVALRDGRVVIIAILTVRSGRVAHIDALVDPVKLAPFRAALGI